MFDCVRGDFSDISGAETDDVLLIRGEKRKVRDGWMDGWMDGK